VGAGEDVIGPDEAAGANDLLAVQQAGDEADGRIGILRDVHDGLAAGGLGFLLRGLEGAHLVGLLGL
jgi:hypothetical protein